MKYLILLAIFVVPACASSPERLQEYYADSVEDCYRYGTDCEIVRPHPICFGGHIDTETCAVLVFEARESDEVQGYRPAFVHTHYNE